MKARHWPTDESWPSCPRKAGSVSETSRRIGCFSPCANERFYGLGQHQHGLLDQKGCVIELLHRNAEVCIPFLLSNQGYGFLWNNPGVGRVELARNGTRWIAEGSHQLDPSVALQRQIFDV